MCTYNLSEIMLATGTEQIEPETAKLFSFSRVYFKQKLAAILTDMDDRYFGFESVGSLFMPIALTAVDIFAIT